MKYIKVGEKGDATSMSVAETARPKHKADELLVKVLSSAVNRADTLQRQGKYPAPEGASEILGLELAGTVEKVGAKAGDWKVGERVFGLVPGGAYAEYAVLHSSLAMRIPESMDFHAAAAIPETFLTAYQALYWIGKLQKGETVLIHAGASGVGSAATQLARQAGAKVLVTASTQKVDVCKKIGAHVSIDYTVGPFAEAVKEQSDGGVDLIIDFIGAPYFQQNLDCLNKDGRMVMLASLGGMKTEEIDLRQILIKRLTVSGSTLRSRSVEYQAQLTADFWDHAGEMLKTGKVKPIIDKVFPIRDISHAHRYMEANRNVGKIVLQVGNMF